MNNGKWTHTHTFPMPAPAPAVFRASNPEVRLSIVIDAPRATVFRAPSRLAWLLEDVGTRTKVTLIHGGFPRTVDQGDYPFGWVWHLEQLKKEAEAAA